MKSLYASTKFSFSVIIFAITFMVSGCKKEEISCNTFLECHDQEYYKIGSDNDLYILFNYNLNFPFFVLIKYSGEECFKEFQLIGTEQIEIIEHSKNTIHTSRSYYDSIDNKNIIQEDIFHLINEESVAWITITKKEGEDETRIQEVINKSFKNYFKICE